MEEKLIQSNTVYEGRIIRVYNDKVRLANGHESYREVVENRGGACVVAVTPDNKVILVRQFRYPYGEEIFEIPAGKFNKGEEPLKTAIRELKEETGYESSNISHFCTVYPSPAYVNEKIEVFLALDIKKGDAMPDEDEFVEIYEVDLDKAVEMINSGEIKDSKTVIGILKYAMLKK